jgi:hypothetical protein
VNSCRGCKVGAVREGGAAILSQPLLRVAASLPKVIVAGNEDVSERIINLGLIGRLKSEFPPMQDSGHVDREFGFVDS